MQIAVNFTNEAIAQKILWILEHFKDDGVEVLTYDDSDEEGLANFKEGLHKIELIKQERLVSRNVQELLDEL